MKVEATLTITEQEYDQGSNLVVSTAAGTYGQKDVHSIEFHTLPQEAPRIGARVHIKVEDA